MTPTYLQPLQISFEKHRNPLKAAQMKAYMKGQFDYYGIPSPARKQLIREHKNEQGFLPDANKLELVKMCWKQQQREWQYFAMDMLGYSVKQEEKSIIRLYEYLIIHKSWWDTIDFIAVNLVGPYFKKYPEAIVPKTTEWLDSGNIWLQRTCLLFQLKYKTTLDTELLESFIGQLSSSKEFFIRKAIGWVLREYSKTNPAYVKEFVKTHELSGLSQREALKWINRKSMG